MLDCQLFKARFLSSPVSLATLSFLRQETLFQIVLIVRVIMQISHELHNNLELIIQL